jgi:hypothetical protein
MFSSILNAITSRVNARFIMILFFPSLIFWGGLAAIFGTDTGLTVLLGQWRALDTGIQWLLIVIALAWVTFFAFLLSNQLVWLTKQFEGYWDWIPKLGEWMMNKRKEYYKQVLKNIDLKKDYEQIYYKYPFPNEPEELMPTRFGNIMKNAERYSWQRYDLEAVLLWPHIFSIMDETQLQPINNARSSLDFMVIISSLSALFAFISGAFLLIVEGPCWLFFICFLGGLMVAWMAHASALEAAINYGQLIKSTFDLYKGKLWGQLGYKKPGSLEEERKSWRRLYELIYKGEVGQSEPGEIDPLKYTAVIDAGGGTVQIKKETEKTDNKYDGNQDNSDDQTENKKEPKDVPDKQKRLLNFTIFVIATLGSLWLFDSNTTTQRIYVPAHDLPAYHLIQEGDLTDIDILKADLHPKGLTEKDALINRYTVEAIAAEKTIIPSQIISPPTLDLVTDTVAVAISTTSAMTYNGKLSPGMVVSIWSVPLGDSQEGAKAGILLPRVLVLDVMQTEGKDDSIDQAYIVVLAVPSASQEEILRTDIAGTLALSLVP